jgi:hypothetical protein
MKYGYEAGLIDKEFYFTTIQKYKKIQELTKKVSELSIVIDEKIKNIVNNKKVPIDEKISLGVGKLLKGLR